MCEVCGPVEFLRGVWWSALMTRMEQGEDTIGTSFGAGVYGTPTVDGEFRSCGPMGFLKTDKCRVGP